MLTRSMEVHYIIICSIITCQRLSLKNNCNPRGKIDALFLNLFKSLKSLEHSLLESILLIKKLKLFLFAKLIPFQKTPVIFLKILRSSGFLEFSALTRD